MKLMPRRGRVWHLPAMSDWAIEYVKHVLEAKDWSMNRLAQEAGVTPSTINRPLREKDWPHSLSRQTIVKIATASGIDPAPFVPKDLAEGSLGFLSPATRGHAAKAHEALNEDLAQPILTPGEIKIAVVGNVAQIVATVDLEGIANLRRKLDALEAMLRD